MPSFAVQVWELSMYSYFWIVFSEMNNMEQIHKMIKD